MATTRVDGGPAGATRRPLLAQSTREALVHVTTAMLVVLVSVSAFAVNLPFGIAATFLVVLGVATVLPASMPIVIVCAFLYQNVVVAWFTPFIPDNNAFDALRGANFVVLMTAYSAFFAASFQSRLRPIAGLRPWLLSSILLSGVIGFYLGARRSARHPQGRHHLFPQHDHARSPASTSPWSRRASTASNCAGAWSGSAAPPSPSDTANSSSSLAFLGLFHGDLYVERDLRRQIETGVWEKTMHETGFVIRGLQDVLTTTFFNTPLLAGIFPDVFRIGGPNFHPISYAYALGVLSTWLLFRRRWLLALAALPLLLVIGSKGAMFMVLVALMARIMWRLFDPRLTVASVVAVSVLWVVAAIAYGSTHGDYHVLGMIAGVKGFLHDPFGQGLGLGGNLSSTTEHVNWEHAQRVGATSVPMESAVGVMLYQMGIGSLAFFGFLAALAVSAYRLLVRTGDLDFLFSLVAVVAISANAVLQEEAFYSPLALGLCMLLIGTAFGNHFRRSAAPAGNSSRPRSGRNAVSPSESHPQVRPARWGGRTRSRQERQAAGRMFWLSRNRFCGSHFRFTSARRPVVAAIDLLDPVALVGRHEVHVGAARRVGRDVGEELARPADAFAVLGPFAPAGVDVHDEVRAAVRIGRGVGRHPRHRAPDMGDEHLAFRSGQPRHAHR